MAKSKAVARPQARPRRRAADTEHITRLFVVGGVVAVIIIAAGVIAFGWYQTQIKPLSKTVLQVGSVKYSLGHLERRMTYQKEQTTYYDQGQAALQLPDDTISQLEVEAKLLQGASELNITVTDEEFATEIKERGNVAEDAKPDVYAAAFQKQVKDSGLHEGEYRQMVKADLLQTKVFDYYRFIAAPSEPQIRANYLIADTQENADEALTRVRAGEDFKTVGDDVSGGQGSGVLEWTPRGGSAFLPQAIEDFLFDQAQVGQVSDPQPVGSLFYVTQLLERDPNRALDDQGRERVAQREISKWLDGLKLTTTQHFSDEDRNRALDDVY